MLQVGWPEITNPIQFSHKMWPVLNVWPALNELPDNQPEYQQV